MSAPIEKLFVKDGQWEEMKLWRQRNPLLVRLREIDASPTSFERSTSGLGINSTVGQTRGMIRPSDKLLGKIAKGLRDHGVDIDTQSFILEWRQWEIECPIKHILQSGIE